MSHGGFRIITPTGLDYISARRANIAIARGVAKLVRAGVIERIIHTTTPTALDDVRCSKPAWGADLKKEQIPASAKDSNCGQTFLPYPQRSEESGGAEFPALARRGAGLG